MTRNDLSKVIAHHNAWADTYDSDIGAMTLYNRVTLDNIRRFLPEDKDALVLDAGGGTGFWAVQIAQMGYCVVLVDVSTEMLEKAKDKVAVMGLNDRVEIRVSDIRDMPEFDDSWFDMVLCEGDPLSYCGHHQSAVREFARVLKSGGTVVASVDNRASAVNWIKNTDSVDVVTRLLETGDIRLPHENEECRYLIHTFTPDELTELLGSNGFTVERIIGKPVIARRLAAFNSDDLAVQEWLYQLELKYCDDPAYYPWAGHLEIVGRKG